MTFVNYQEARIARIRLAIVRGDSEQTIAEDYLDQAVVYAGLGDVDSILSLLERGLADPRSTALLKRAH